MSITNSLAGIAVTDLVVVGDRTSSKSVKTAIVHDPDGNQIVFAQGFDKAHLSSSS